MNTIPSNYLNNAQVNEAIETKYLVQLAQTLVLLCHALFGQTKRALKYTEDHVKRKYTGSGLRTLENKLDYEYVFYGTANCVITK